MQGRKQGSVGITLDSFIDSLNVTINHIKIDVDGNEGLILLGADQTLKSHNVKSILIELDIFLKNYNDIISLIESFGFVKTYPDDDSLNINVNMGIRTINHIFTRAE